MATVFKASEQNPLGLKGIEFVEFAASGANRLQRLFSEFGFAEVGRLEDRSILHFKQNDINFLINSDTDTYGFHFAQDHGPSISAMGWRVENADEAFEGAIERGARPCFEGDYRRQNGDAVPAIFGIGGSLIYFIEDYGSLSCYEELGFVQSHTPVTRPDKGFIAIDHLTNNVEKGEMKRWADFYKNVFGFTEVRYFDIRGTKTGLTSYALQSPSGNFCIPINEGTEEKSQINEYLREYRGPGIQHLAFLTNDIVSSLKSLQGSPIETLDIDSDYYQTVFDRVPNVTENRKELEQYGILVDGDEKGYLLQIFTKNLIGPIFIEIIQRKNHNSFGEGNFGALFRSIERDQERRGVLQ
jgi:4-hydroxyphenylpyruvate dioxygenase